MFKKRKVVIFWLALFWVGIVTAAVLKLEARPAIDTGKISEREVIAAAVDLYKKRAAGGMSMDNGPCLTNDLMPGWVVDIVHSPREPMDDLPQNQCPAYLEGRAKHFVELDTNGNLVRVQ